jgi:hypothetical protein
MRESCGSRLSCRRQASVSALAPIIMGPGKNIGRVRVVSLAIS